jgi:hypothetical protein
MLEGSEGFDMAAGVWKKSGWKELKDLRKVRTRNKGKLGRGDEESVSE